MNNALQSVPTASGNSLPPMSPLTASSSTQVSSRGIASAISRFDLGILSVSVQQNAVWKLNQPIDITFDRPIDFSTVHFNTLLIVDSTGATATGTYIQPLDGQGNPRREVVRFVPDCPTTDDFTDAGFSIGKSYQLWVFGESGSVGGVTIVGAAGAILRQTLTVDFTTPLSNDPAVLFHDTEPGPPQVVLIPGPGGHMPGADFAATYLEVGEDMNNRYYFGNNGLGSFEVPLNLYSDLDTRVALLLQLNQAILNTSSNLNPGMVTFEFEETPGIWTPLGSTVTVEENCGALGSVLRVTPLGLLPQGSSLRLLLKQGFRDLVGDATIQDNAGFAPMDSVTILDDGGLADEGADELFEGFQLGGLLAGSLEDTSSPLDYQRAHWGSDGKLVAAFGFDGTGGPGGDFDYHVPVGQTIVINTTLATIVGGPGGVPTASQTIVGGVIDLRNLVVPAGSRLVFQGPNPVTILATGSVSIEGEVLLNGGNSDGVGTLNTTFQPEPGALGNAGGGRGGIGSYLTTTSTPRGGSGWGAFSSPGGGGQGGETTYTTSSNKDNRRAAGGGGGGFGSDIFYDHDADSMTIARHCQTLIGMDGEGGFAGSAQGTGAVSQLIRAQGGALGPGPFVDPQSDNNFYGTKVAANGTKTLGELQQRWAGAGGGAGGDAARVTSAGFPRIPFHTGGDEKGSGGGGGGGGISILALGPIAIQNGGRLVADGGHGGGGENVIFFDRIGGGSGGGSGGHIVLASADSISILDVATNAGPGYRDTISGHRGRSVSALGGQGGAGHNNSGGANEQGPSTWRCDAIDLARLNVDGVFVSVTPGVVGTSEDVPPLQNQTACFRQGGMSDWLDPDGPVLGAGGDGAPGIIQLHVPNPATDLHFAFGTTWNTADLTQSLAPTPVGWNGIGAGHDTLLPLFGTISVAQSRWIPLGLARTAPGGGPDDQVQFFFGGTSPLTGSVTRGAGNLVQPLADVLPASALQSPGTLPYVDASGLLLHMDGSNLDHSYKVNAKLMLEFSVVLEDSVNSMTFQVVASALRPGDRLALLIDSSQNMIDDFISTASGTVTVALRPNFFRMSTAGDLDRYPTNSDVQIWFDATVNDANGLPDGAQSFSAGNGGLPATDANALNAQNWDYFRFGVTFDVNASGGPFDISAPRPALDFLRLPFKF